MFFDTHSHLNFKAFDQDRDKVIKRSLKEGVFMINVGSDYGNSKLAVEIAEKYQTGVYASIALHPIHTKDEEFDYEKYKTLSKSAKVVAIGETGLDEMYPNDKQKEVFLQHLELARELGLPVILHCRKAHQELIKDLRFRIQDSRIEIKGVIHCFTGKWSEAKQYLDMGFYLGFNGIIFKMDLDEVIKKAPLERMLLETDCPYLTPLVRRSRRGKGDLVCSIQPGEDGLQERNEPVNVKYIAQRIAEIRGESIEKIAGITFQNAKNLFKHIA